MIVVAAVAYLAAEIAAFVAVGEQIGFGAAAALLIGVSLLGPVIVRRVGLAAVGRARARLDAGESPTRDVIDGVVLLAGGLLVCVPGFVSDAAGLALLIGPVRHVVIRLAGHRVGRRLGRFRSARWGVIDVTSRGGGSPPPPASGRAITWAPPMPPMPPMPPAAGPGDPPASRRP